MKPKTIPLIASISLVVFGMGIFGLLGAHNKLLNLRLAQQENFEPDSQSPIPISKRTILLLIAVGVIGALSAHRKRQTIRITSQTTSPQKPDDLKGNSSRIPHSGRYLELDESHMKTYYELKNAVCGDANFIILTGDSGAGKSKLIQFLKKEIFREYIIFETGSEFQDVKDLYKLIAARTNLNKNFKSKGAFFIHLNRYLHTVQAESKKILFIVTDFNSINVKLIKELTFLSNIAIRNQKIIKILISGENISFSPDQPFKPESIPVITCSLKQLNRSEAKNDIHCIPEKINTKNSILPQEKIQKNTLDLQSISGELNKIHNHKLNFENEQKSIYFFGKIKQLVTDDLIKGLVRVHSYIQKATKNLFIKQRNYLNTSFFSAVRFDSLLWNSVLSISLFSVTMLFALWYQGILPLKPDAFKFEESQKKLYSQGIDQKTYRDKHIIKSSEPLTISAKKQFSTDQKLSAVVNQDIIKSKFTINKPGATNPTYYVQVGAFLIEGNAIKTILKLKEKGYLAKIVPFTDSRDRLWHTVRIGEYSSLKAAKKHSSEFSNKENMDSIVLSSKQQ